MARSVARATLNCLPTPKQSYHAWTQVQTIRVFVASVLSVVELMWFLFNSSEYIPITFSTALANTRFYAARAYEELGTRNTEATQSKRPFQQTALHVLYYAALYAHVNFSMVACFCGKKLETELARPRANLKFVSFSDRITPLQLFDRIHKFPGRA